MGTFHTPHIGPVAAQSAGLASRSPQKLIVEEALAEPPLSLCTCPQKSKLFDTQKKIINTYLKFKKKRKKCRTQKKQ
jgi:hypothetical protein